MTVKRGRNFLMTPGPSNVPERVLQAMMRNAVDLGSPEFVEFSRRCIDDLKPIFKTDKDVFLYTANGHGAWEAALANALSPGDRVLVPGTGQFSEGWAIIAESLGLRPDTIASDWRHAVDPNAVEDALRADRDKTIKAVLLVHTDTATGISNDITAIRQAMDNADHPALLLVDAVASLATTEFEMDAWRVDVAVSASQKGMMCPPGISFTAVSEKAMQAAKATSGTRYYWDWQKRLEPEWYRWYCGTAPEHLLFALRAALDMLMEEGLQQAFTRHQRLANAVRAAVAVWSEAGVVGLNALDPTCAADSVTTIRLADGYDANQVKALCSDTFNVSLGGGLGQLHGKAFRIAHMGYSNEPTILGAMASVEAALQICQVPYGKGGVGAAVDYLAADLGNVS